MYVYKVLILIKSSFQVCIDSEAGRCNMYENCKSTVKGHTNIRNYLIPLDLAMLTARIKSVTAHHTLKTGSNPTDLEHGVMMQCTCY